MKGALRAILVGALGVWPEQLLAAEGGHDAALSINGAELSLLWAVPFAGVLLSIAVIPLLLPRFWHHHFGKVTAFWAGCFLIPFLLTQGIALTVYQVLHVALLEYIPFIILLLTLFTVAGGVRLKGQLSGSPMMNTLMLLAGTVIASWMGTTGAAMLLIRPMISANQWRQHKGHIFIFFIFLVANVGGSLTPLGDPPLFLGFLKGVDFFWPTVHLLPLTLAMSAALLTIFFLLDSWRFRQEPKRHDTPKGKEKFGLEGKVNILLLGAVVGAVLLSGLWKPGFGVTIFHVEMEAQNIARDLLLLGITALSLKLTSKEDHHANAFSWGPILEVGKLFAGIFLTIIPAIAILKAGSHGALSAVVNAVTDPATGQPINAMYFWFSGILSSLLDNAPTYLVFFNTAGGDAAALMGPMSGTLVAISAGSVFMGANTYIGNAPNFMVKSICEERGIRMPSFFGYMALSTLFLGPLYVLLTMIFF